MFSNTLSTQATQLHFCSCLFTEAEIFSCEHQQNANLLKNVPVNFKVTLLTTT